MCSLKIKLLHKISYPLINFLAIIAIICAFSLTNLLSNSIALGFYWLLVIIGLFFFIHFLKRKMERMDKEAVDVCQIISYVGLFLIILFLVIEGYNQLSNYSPELITKDWPKSGFRSWSISFFFSGLLYFIIGLIFGSACITELKS